MTEFNKSLSAALGIEVSNTSVTILDTNVQGTEVELPSSTDKDAGADYTFSRDTFRKLVTKGTKAIDDATELDELNAWIPALIFVMKVINNFN